MIEPEEGFRVIDGHAAVNAWDQAHAEALNRLRQSDAFILITWETFDAQAQVVLCAKDGGAMVGAKMLEVALPELLEAYEDIERAA